MAPEAIGTGTLERLSALPTAGATTLSVYLDLEAGALCTPAARDSQLRSLSSEPDLACAQADIDQVRELVAADATLARPARGMAIFSCAQAGIFEVLRLPCAVEPLVVLDTAAWLEPLVDMIAFGDRAVVVLGPDTVRLLRGSPTTLTEFATLEQRASQHSCHPGPRSPSTRDPDPGAQCDATKIAEQLLRAHRRRALTDLVIIAPEPVSLPLDAALHPELRTVLRGVINTDLAHASTSELMHIVAPIFDGAEHARERAALSSLENSLLTEHTAAHGLAGAFAMLEQHRVAVLLIAEGAHLTVGLCRQCGRVSTSPRGCEFDGTNLVSIDAVAHATDLAADQHAEIMVIRHERDRLIEHGAIATLARPGNATITAPQTHSLPPAPYPTPPGYHNAARRPRIAASAEMRDAGITHPQPTHKRKEVSWLEH
jgi:hypothetical protein